jgi:hypothetical protein
MTGREGVMSHGRQEEGQRQEVLTLKQKHEIHELARKVKGTYVQLMRLCKELDIPFPS